MLNLDDIVSNKKENKGNDWPFRMLIIKDHQDQVKQILYYI